MWHHVVQYKFSDVSEECTVSIFRAKEQAKQASMQQGTSKHSKSVKWLEAWKLLYAKHDYTFYIKSYKSMQHAGTVKMYRHFVDVMTEMSHERPNI